METEEQRHRPRAVRGTAQEEAALDLAEHRVVDRQRAVGQIEQRAESASLVRFYYRRSQHHPRRWREMASILLVPSESLSEPANAMDAES